MAYFDIPPSADVRHNEAWVTLAKELRVHRAAEEERLANERRQLKPLEKAIAKLRGQIYLAKRR